MTGTNARSPRSRRRALNLALALGAGLFGGCTPSTWLEEKKLGRVVFPRGILPIMLFRSDQVRAVDRDDLTDVIADALAYELGRYGISTTVVELAGVARSPRLELSLWRISRDQPHAGFPSIVADCAFVSPGEQIAFVGRISAQAYDNTTPSSVDRIALAIAEKLASLA